MGGLRALLIAVPSELEFTGGDAARIKDALLGSGWAGSDVTVLDTAERTTRPGIYGALNTFLAACGDDDFALVYFSGHGVRIDGAEYLVPSDTDAAAGRKSMIGVLPDELLEELHTRATVMLCLDACRDDMAGGSAGPPPPPTPARSRENVVLVHACAPGRPALGTNAGSFLGRALAEALSPDSPPRTVEEVISSVRRRTGQIAEDNGCHRKHWVYDTWLGGSPGRPPAEHAGRRICEAGPGSQQWAAALHSAGLWDRITDADDVDTGRLKDLLSQLLDKVLAIRQDTARPNRAGPDPWDDPGYPERVLRQLDRLVPAGPEGALSPVEAVTLLATPFVREAAVACGRRALAEVYPPQGPGEEVPEASGRTDGTRHHLGEDMADVRKAYGQIDAKRRRLLAGDDLASAVAAEQWLRHRLLAGWDQLRESPAGGGQPMGALDSLTNVLDQLTEAAVCAAGFGPYPPPRSRDRLRSAVFQVVSQMRTRPVDTAPNGEDWQVNLDKRLGMSRRRFWRPQRLAELLHIAELLAIDPRLLDGIVVDHLGVRHHMVEPADVVAQVGDSEFRPVMGHTGRRAPARRGDWTLHAECGSAALHVALERQAEAAAVAARNIYKAHAAEDLLAALPKAVTTDALEPADDAAYEAPPPRFQLAEDGVKPLIMGTQLYGDRMLAVRELYQNALDACRRRWARQRYAADAGSPAKELAEYTIEFVLARDEEDRVYIECRDDGIGMTAEELSDLFARAGRRYEQSPTRVSELRRWRRKGIDPELNSRFGIGAFSYFMLAEHIQVTTRPAGLKGHGAAGPGHRVDIVADSGLMHITRYDDELVGTRVRLYLRPEFSADPPSVIDFLSDNVWLSPVKIRVEERSDDRTVRTVWRPHELRPDIPLAVQQPDPSHGIWWVRGLGARLVDGILVRGDSRPYGYVINLRRRHKPELSASRNELIGFSQEVVDQELRSAIDELRHWDPIRLEWLWELTDHDKRLAESVVDRLLSMDVTVATDDWYDSSSHIGRRFGPLAAVGCLPIDNKGFLVAAGDRSGTSGMHFFHYWRSQLMSHSRDDQSVLGYPKGFPGPSALDTVLFHRDDRVWASTVAALGAAASGSADLRTAVRALRRYAVAGLPVPATDDIRALDNLRVDSAMVSLYRAYTSADASPSRTTPASPPEHAPLLLTAGNLRKPIGYMAELVRRLRILDPRIPEPPDPGDLGQHIPEQAEYLVLSPNVTGLSLPRSVTPIVAAYLARRTGVAASRITEVAERYARFGYRVTGRCGETRMSDDDADALGIEGVLHEARDLYQEFSVLTLVRLSAERSDADVATTAASVRAARVRLSRDLDTEEVVPASLLSVKAPPWWGSLPSTEPVTLPVSNWRVLRALAEDQRETAVDDEVAAVRALAEAGVVSANAAEVVRKWRDAPYGTRPVLLVRSRWHMSSSAGAWSFHASTDPAVNRVGTDFLFALAAQAGASIGAVTDTVRAEAEPYGIEVEHVPAETRGLRPNLSEFNAFCPGTTIRWRTNITLASIIDYAADRAIDLPTAASRLRAYEPLGAPRIPDAGTGRELPTGQLRTAVEKLLRYEPLYDGTVTPLALTVTAVRLDLGLRSAYQALAPYADFGLVLACPEPADDGVEPDWRDVIILSRHLTGSEPGLSGEVSADHIQLAAEETELSAADVRERLTAYAPLFGLRLPPKDAEEPGAQREETTHATP